MKNTFFTFVLGALLAASASADVTLPSVISDHMVLQREAKVAVWGQAAPGEEVAVSFAQQTGKTVTDDKGAWRITLDAMPASATGREMVVRGHNTLTLTDVLVGEVWIASGQSNMEWPLGRSQGGNEAVAASDDEQLRLFTGKKNTSETPVFDNSGQWRVAAPGTTPGFSAVAYYFARQLRKELDVPVGVIHISWGGTPAEAWTPRQTLAADPDLSPILERFEKSREGHAERHAAWEKERDARLALPPQERGPWPQEPYGPGHSNQPAGLFNGMVLPVAPFTCRGVIWYQGESNVGRAEQYRTLFPAMIAAWRNTWNAPELPFLFVQLANIGKPSTAIGNNAWAELQDAQRYTLDTVPHTGMAVINDIGTADNIHPPNKLDVGQRLARWALADVYGKQLVKSGPLFKSVNFEGNKATVTFDTFGGKLTTRDGQPAGSFILAGEDRVFHPAKVIEMKDDSLVLVSDEVAQPVAVRYAWNSNPAEANLLGGDGLHASLFRSDDWPGATAGKR